MRAAVRFKYGTPEVLQIQEVPVPDLTADRLLVRVRACSLNKADWYALTGTPLVARPQMGLRNPKTPIVGLDYSGTVEAVGSEVTGFSPGDEVFGAANGGFAEYVTVRDAAPKPASITFEEAAALPTAGATALQALRDHGEVKPGHKVLINGASGGVGTFAVQIAKVLGAEVTAVCSTGNVESVGSVGADHVIDYTKEDFTRTGERYDLVIDVAGSRPWWQMKRALAPNATVVVVGAPTGNRLLGPLTHIISTRLASTIGSHRAVFFIAKFSRPDLELIAEMVEEGKVKAVIDRQYDFTETADAFHYLGEGHAKGKIVTSI